MIEALRPEVVLTGSGKALLLHSRAFFLERVSKKNRFGITRMILTTILQPNVGRHKDTVTTLMCETMMVVVVDYIVLGYDPPLIVNVS